MVVVLGAPVFTYHVYSEGSQLPAGVVLFQLTDDPSAAAWASAGSAVITTLRPASGQPARASPGRSPEAG